MFILINIEYRNPETRNSRNWFRYETFIHLFQFKGFSTSGEWCTIFLCWLFYLPTPTTTTTFGTPPQTTGLISASPESQPSSSEARTQFPDFFQIPQILRARFGAWHRSHTWFHSYLGFLFWHLWMTHPTRVCAWTPALMLHLTNPCAKRKVLSLTKLKGKINKTKSLGHYITWILFQTDLYVLFLLKIKRNRFTK